MHGDIVKISTIGKYTLLIHSRTILCFTKSQRSYESDQQHLKNESTRKKKKEEADRNYVKIVFDVSVMP